MARNVVRWVGAALAVTAALGFTPPGCGGSGGRLGAAAAEQGDAEMPEGVAREIRTCAAEHMHHLGPGQRSVSFDVKLASDGEVDSVALLESTLGDEELEACMASALRALSEGDLPLRHSGRNPRGPAAPESRALMGQVQALNCLTSPPCLLVVAFFIGAAYVAVQIYVHAQSQSSTAKPKPRTAPTATTVPTSIPVGKWSRLPECDLQYEQDTRYCHRFDKKQEAAKCRANASERLAYCNKTGGQTGHPPRYTGGKND